MGEMAIDREIQEANNRLLRKRQERQATVGQSLEVINWKAIGEKYAAICHDDKPMIELVYPVRDQEEEKPYYPTPDLPQRYYNYRFDNFTGNDPLVSDLRRMIDVDCDICLTGDTGCGKTHLACALLNEIKTRDESKFISVPALLVKARSSFRDNSPITEDDLISEYTRCSVLCLDDLGAEKTTSYSIQVLYLIIEQRISEGKRTIITTNLSLPEIERQIDKRIASRISGMVNIKINMPDYRKKRG